MRRSGLIVTAIVAVMGCVATEALALPQGSPSDHFPPDPQVEWKHLRLDIVVPDLNDSALDASAKWTFVPDGARIDSLRLDAGAKMEIRSVTQVAPKLTELIWSHDTKILEIQPPDGGFGAGSPPRTPVQVVIKYSLRNPDGGLTFSKATPGVDGRAPQGAELHSQGQPQSNHNWFPVHDFPNIRVSTELMVDVPKGIAVSSNGRLVFHMAGPSREVWHWIQEQPHVPYLVSLVAGTFQRTELSAPMSGVPMAVWTQPQDAGMVAATYGRTDAMIVCLERRFGMDYPWDRYDQLVVRNFGAGGMENTSATTMHPGALLDETALLESDIDGLISHELCHQWTGDLVTCRSWEHIWLNEGWATYGSALWEECHEGEDAYSDAILGAFAVARGDTGMMGKDPVRPSAPMCSHNYSHPGETFRRDANPYPKGSSILHMLRRKLGDDLFFKGVDLYFDRFALKLVETDDFRHALEEVSHRSLEGFFDQWCYSPGCPRVKVVSSYDAATRMLSLTISQGDRAPGLPPFVFDIPIVVRSAEGERIEMISVDAKETVRQIELASAPTMIAVDPWLDVLKVLEVEIPEELLAEQALRGPTSASRRMAMRALSSKDSPVALAMLGSVVRDKARRTRERVEAAEAISSIGSPDARTLTRALFDELVTPTLGKNAKEAAAMCAPGLRDTLVQAVAVAPISEALPRLLRVVQDDHGYAPRVEAIKGIARLGSVDAPADRAAIGNDPAVAAAIDAALAQRTPQERLRSAAVEACGSLALTQFLAKVEALAAPGHADRLRPVAIEAMGRLVAVEAAKTEKPRVVAVLVGYLNDSEGRSRDAAGEALAALKAPEALEPLEAIVKNGGSERFSDRASGWLGKIRQ